MKCFFIHGSSNSDSVVFRNEGFGEMKDDSTTTAHFKKFFCYGSFRYVSSLRKKVFQHHQWIIFFLYDSNNSDSVVSGNVGFTEIKDHSLRTTLCQKKYCYDSLGSVSIFLFLAQITQILLFSGRPILERRKITVWKWHLFKKIFCYESFGYVSTLRKKAFSGAPVKCYFLCVSQITKIILCFGMPVLEKSEITVWKRHHFKKEFYCRNFRYMSPLRKKVILGALVECFLLYDSKNSDSVVFENAGFPEIKDHCLRTTPFQKLILLLTF